MDLSPERVRVGESLPAMVVMGLGRPGPGPDIVEPEDRDRAVPVARGRCAHRRQLLRRAAAGCSRPSRRGCIEAARAARSAGAPRRSLAAGGGRGRRFRLRRSRRKQPDKSSRAQPVQSYSCELSRTIQKEEACLTYRQPHTSAAIVADIILRLAHDSEINC